MNKLLALFLFVAASSYGAVSVQYPGTVVAAGFVGSGAGLTNISVSATNQVILDMNVDSGSTDKFVAVSNSTPKYAGQIGVSYGGGAGVGSASLVSLYIGRSVTQGDWFSVNTMDDAIGWFGSEGNMKRVGGSSFTWLFHANGNRSEQTFDFGSTNAQDSVIGMRNMNLWHPSMLTADTVKWINPAQTNLGTTLDEYGAAYWGVGNPLDNSEGIRDVIFTGGNGGRPFAVTSYLPPNIGENQLFVVYGGNFNHYTNATLASGIAQDRAGSFWLDPTYPYAESFTNAGAVFAMKLDHVTKHLVVGSTNVGAVITPSLWVGTPVDPWPGFYENLYTNGNRGFEIHTNGMFDSEDTQWTFDSEGSARLGIIKKNGQYPQIVYGSNTVFTIGESSVENLSTTAVSSQTLTPTLTITNHNTVLSGTILAQGFVSPQLASIPTNDIPASDASHTNWWFGNLNGIPTLIATNRVAGGWLEKALYP